MRGGAPLDSKIAECEEIAARTGKGDSAKMDLANIKDATDWFQVLQTSRRTQTAMMTLAPGDDTGRTAEAHEKSDQVLLILATFF
jgi:mannose-6-phosphate isomerase-like protein (cupin superfamily)